MVASLALVYVCVALATLKAQEGCFLVGMGTETKYTSARERQLRSWRGGLRRCPPVFIYIKKQKQIECAEKNVHGRAWVIWICTGFPTTLKPTTNDENGVPQGCSATLSRGKPQFLEMDENFVLPTSQPDTTLSPNLHQTRVRHVPGPPQLRRSRALQK